jgi:hypothetical protein
VTTEEENIPSLSLRSIVHLCVNFEFCILFVSSVVLRVYPMYVYIVKKIVIIFHFAMKYVTLH